MDSTNTRRRNTGASEYASRRDAVDLRKVCENAALWSGAGEVEHPAAAAQLIRTLDRRHVGRWRDGVG